MTDRGDNWRGTGEPRWPIQFHTFPTKWKYSRDEGENFIERASQQEICSVDHSASIKG